MTFVGNLSTTSLYVPLMPTGRYTRFYERWRAHSDTYNTLASNYFGDPSWLATPPGLSIDDLNTDSAAFVPKGPVLTTPYLMWDDAFGTRFAGWPLLYSVNGAPITDPEETWTLKVYGVVMWQMLQITYCIQIIRLGEFGHFGRK